MLLFVVAMATLRESPTAYFFSVRYIYPLVKQNLVILLIWNQYLFLSSFLS